ncbi:hypothetical protein HDA40_004436 [Hamadaea flava]|uniref:DUF5666 domain-containing protein n=1 Tax=Hamadaea flava TaxID=1742688 RepID=A0ABV8LE69_9ACTN|nr:hypothetical protein [Hamadaea flava]MCP2325929.1 hypothetical protein [Hamadaea flava]
MSKHSDQATGIDDPSAPIDDLAVGLAKAERKPWLTRSTLILGGAVLVVAGFIGGLQVGGGTEATANTPGGGNNRGAYGFPGGGYGFPGGGNFGQQGAGTGQQGTGNSTRNATTGKIKLIDGNTVYVELTDGTVVTVKVSDSTKVQSSSTITVKDLKAGASVTVQGQTGSDGTITAGTITATK